MPVDDTLYPVNLRVTGRPCLVVGGGRVAADKAAGLLECGAVVHVVAPELGEDLAAMLAAAVAAPEGGDQLTAFEAFKFYGGQLHAVEAFIRILPIEKRKGGWE